MSTCTLFINKYITRQCFRCMSTTRKQSSGEYCIDLVKNRDYENFLCTLLLPTNIKAAGFVIRAFNVEIAQVEDQVTQSHIGLMRLQFWHEMINNVFDGKPPQTPVTLQLHKVLERHKLSKRYFKRLIDARLDRIKKSTFPTIQDIENYAENAFSPIYYLLLEAYNVKDMNADHAASHLGKAHGIVTFLRSIPYHAQKRVVVLPEDILMKHNVSSEALLRNTEGTALSNVIFEVASHAKQHLDKAISLNASLECKEIFLPITCIENYLVALRKTDFNVFHSYLARRNGFLPLQLLWRKISPYSKSRLT